jgi:magnesium chelatase accessory protein
MTPARLDWTRDGADWPNRAASRFVRAGGLSWHVQVAGEGECALLIHGTGASTHSWRGLWPLMARGFRAIAPDLPGHGFTDPLPWSRLSLPGMAEAVGALVRKLEAAPRVIVGHSAGAAIAIRMALDGIVAPRLIVSLNGALFPIADSFARPFFVGAAKLLALNPLTPWLFARRARDPRAVRRLLDGTGSAIHPQDEALYARLAASPGHVAGALGMMAGWDLAALQDDLPRLKSPLLLVVGEADAMVPPGRIGGVAARVPKASVARLPGLGHLAHEEAPERVFELIRSHARESAHG